jgi:hypothetical protein
MGISYPKDTLISLANSEKRKLQYRSRTYGTPCTLHDDDSRLEHEMFQPQVQTTDPLERNL